MMRICGGILFFIQSFALCSTPKRCCSSMMARPRFLNLTLSSSTAWVPTKIWSVPFSSSEWMIFRSAALVEPVKSLMFTPVPKSASERLLKCCCAKISVGAIIQLWKPLSIAISIESSATMVFPEPTSPCRRRFICIGSLMSFRISFKTLFWALVSSKGILFW